MTFPTPCIDSNEIEARKRKLLNVLLYIISIITLIVLLLSLFALFNGVAGSQHEIRQLKLAFIVIITGLVLVFIINRYSSRIVASILFLLLLLFAITLSDDPLEIVDGRTLFMFSLPILIASSILKPWASFVFAGLSSLEIAIIGIQIQEFPNIPAMGGFFIIATISWLSAHNTNRTSENLYIANVKLKDSEKRYRSLYKSSKDASPFPI